MILFWYLVNDSITKSLYFITKHMSLNLSKWTSFITYFNSLKQIDSFLFNFDDLLYIFVRCIKNRNWVFFCILKYNLIVNDWLNFKLCSTRFDWYMYYTIFQIVWMFSFKNTPETPRLRQLGNVWDFLIFFLY